VWKLTIIFTVLMLLIGPLGTVPAFSENTARSSNQDQNAILLAEIPKAGEAQNTNQVSDNPVEPEVIKVSGKSILLVLLSGILSVVVLFVLGVLRR